MKLVLSLDANRDRDRQPKHWEPQFRRLRWCKEFRFATRFHHAPKARTCHENYLCTPSGLSSRSRRGDEGSRLHFHGFGWNTIPCPTVAPLADSHWHYSKSPTILPLVGFSGVASYLEFVILNEAQRNEGSAPDEPVAILTRSETITLFPFVLKHALAQITGHFDIESAVGSP